MANKIISVKNNRSGSVSIETVTGLVPLDPGSTGTGLEVTDSQLARIQAVANLAITAGLDADTTTSFLGLIKEADLNTDVFDQLKLNTVFDSIDTFARMLSKAAAGDMVLSISPATVTGEAATEDFTRSVTIKLTDSEGAIHTWYSADLAASIAEVTVGTGAAAITDTTPPMVAGVCTVPISCTGAWAAGVAQVETATAAGTVTTAGNASVTVKSALFEADEVVAVPVVVDDDANAIAAAIRTALASNEVVSAGFNVSGEDAAVILTAKVPAANDATLNIAIADGTGDGASVGVTTAATSADTVPGVAPDTNTLTISNKTIMGYTVTGGTSVMTIV